MNAVERKEKHHPLHYCERFFKALHSPRAWAISSAMVISLVALVLAVGVLIFHFADLIPTPFPVWMVISGGLLLIGSLYWLLRRSRRFVRELDLKIKEAENPLYYTEKFFRELYSPREWAKASAIVLSIVAILVVGWAVILLSMGGILVDDLVWVVIVGGSLALSVLYFWLLRRTRRLVREVNAPLADEQAPAQTRDR